MEDTKRVWVVRNRFQDAGQVSIDECDLFTTHIIVVGDK